MKTAFITGVNGQDGSLLAKFLLDKDYKVIGMQRRTSSPTDWRLKELGLYKNEKFITVSGDMTDQTSLDRIVCEYYPDEIYNLAAQSYVGTSWDNWESTSDITALGPVRLFEVVKRYTIGQKPKIYQASSSEMFGGANRVETLDESSVFQPRSPYGASKCYAHHMAEIYRKSYDMFISCGILFNHESAYRGQEFVTRKISIGVSKIACGLQDYIELGNLDSCRDWGAAQDYVEAMWLMLQQDSPNDFVIATGEANSIRDLLEQAFCSAGVVPDLEKYVKINKKYIRPADVGYLLGDYNKARRILGWRPKTTFGQLIFGMVQKDIKRVKDGQEIVT